MNLNTIMKYIVGLGNKGPKYKFSRHNAGFLFLDFLKSALNLPNWKTKKNLSSLLTSNQKVKLYKPQTYMNSSGQIVKKICRQTRLKIEKELIIVHDDLDIPLGKWKFNLAKGPKEHNGILSIEQSLGQNNFWRLRIGVDNRSATHFKSTGTDYLLSPFQPEELDLLKNKVFPEIINYLDQDAGLV